MIKPLSLIVTTCVIAGGLFLTFLVVGESTDKWVTDKSINGSSTSVVGDDLNYTSPTPLTMPDKLRSTGGVTSTTKGSVKVLELDDKRVINIGEYIDPNDPHLLSGSDGTEVNIGEYINVNDLSRQESGDEPQNIGQPINVDDLGFLGTKKSVEYQDIGPEIMVDQLYSSEDVEPRDIGPNIGVDNFLAK